MIWSQLPGVHIKKAFRPSSPIPKFWPRKQITRLLLLRIGPCFEFYGRAQTMYTV